jgi:hypothetical protein
MKPAATNKVHEQAANAGGKVMLELACIADLKMIVAIATWGSAFALVAAVGVFVYRSKHGEAPRARVGHGGLWSQRA